MSRRLESRRRAAAGDRSAGWRASGASAVGLLVYGLARRPEAAEALVERSDGGRAYLESELDARGISPDYEGE